MILEQMQYELEGLTKDRQLARRWVDVILIFAESTPHSIQEAYSAAYSNLAAYAGRGQPIPEPATEEQMRRRLSIMAVMLQAEEVPAED